METAWLIEEMKPDGSGSMMRALGVCYGIEMEHIWTTFDSALRFAREEDAEKVGNLLIGKGHWKPVEHSWG